MCSVLYQIFGALPDWLYRWQTLIGAIFAALVAALAAIVAWKAAMKQIAAIQSERDRRAAYASRLAVSYLAGLKEILSKVQREESRLARITEDTWRHDPEQILSILRSAQSAFLEPTGWPQSDDLEQYREELPLFLFVDLRLVFRLEKDLSVTVAQLLAEQGVLCTFPISDCQKRFRDATNKLKQAIDSAELSFDRFRYE